MAKTANELLSGILKTVSSIDKNMKREQKGKKSTTGGVKDALNISGALLKFGKVKSETIKTFTTFLTDIMKIANESQKGKSFKVFAEGMVSISSALPDMVKGLNDLGNIKTRKVDKALNTMRKLYAVMDELGGGRSARRVDRAIRLFNRLGRALRRISAPLRILANFLTYLGLSFVVFAVSMVAAAAILKIATKPKDDKGGGLILPIVGVVLGTVAVMVGALVLLTLAHRFIKPGLNVIKGIGKGLMMLSLGILGFTLSLLLVATAMHAGLGFAGIMKSMLILGGIIVGIVGLFALLGVAGRFVKKGVLTTALIGIGLAIIAVSVGFLITTAAGISGMLGGGVDKKKVTFLGIEVPDVVKGLGTIAMIFIGAAALFGILGLPGVNVAVGIGTGIALLIAGTLWVIADSIQKLVLASKDIGGGFKDNIKNMIGGLLGGTIEGITEGLTGKASTGPGKLVAAVKNTAILMSSMGILFTVSLTLSQFAKAITAFAELDRMKVIEGYDKNGKPIFGEKVDISRVSKNIASTISTFLLALIDSTSGLKNRQTGKIRRMGRALTGKRGILSAVIQFTEALQVYAQYGPDGMIGYSYFEEGKPDADGNMQYIEKRGKVSINVVATNMVTAFAKFVDELTAKTEEEFGPDRRGRKQIKKIAKMLSGKHGILGPIAEFAQTLQIFSKIQDNKLPILDEDGKPTGKYITVEDVATNIVTTLNTFSTTLADQLEGSKAKDATKQLRKYDHMINKLSKLSSSLDGLSKMAASIKDLAEGIGTLGVNLDKLNTEKLLRILEKTSIASTRPVYAASEGPLAGAGSLATTNYTTVTGDSDKTTNWEDISQMIGEQVGARVTGALKNGMFKFEFDTTKSGGTYYWDPH